MRHITKKEARKQFNKGFIVSFLPSRFDANCCIYALTTVRKTDLSEGVTFNKYIEDYENTYCNNNVGNKVKFWDYV